MAAAKKTPAQKGADTRKYNAEVKDANAKRETFEASNPTGKTNPPVGRMDGIRQQVGKAYDNVPIKHLYRTLGYSDHSPNLHGQQELEGPAGSDVWHGQHTMNPTRDMMPTPRRWEEFAPHEQARVMRSAAKFGVTPDSAHKALAAQVDQAYATEGGHHDSFYAPEKEFTRNGSRTPRNELLHSAKKNGVTLAVQAAANAATSPNNTFVQRDSATGKARFPNNEAADHAIQWAQSGKTGAEYEKHKDYYVPNEDKVDRTIRKRNGQTVTTREKRPDDPRKYPVQGYPRNHAKAVDAVTKVLGGTQVRDAWPNKGDKVSAYHNSFIDPHGSSQFWVSDTHSGGAAIAPHLPKEGSGSQAAYMGIKGIHAFNDHIARNVMKERGLNSISNMQSAQWSANKRYTGDSTDDALNSYGTGHQEHSGLNTSVHPDQGHFEEGGNTASARGIIPSSRDVAAAVRGRRK
ncbi:hypothetical protein ACFRNJ_12205 [Streptomyces sp. NPDC056721]|uniref:hypothetical protein n=1 Tax=Streptomyces sp. NPDC056721 TaxID=3345923 RepID=UPI003682994E